MLCYLWMLMLSSALAGVIDDNSYDATEEGTPLKFVIPYESLTLPDVKSYVKELEEEASQTPENNDEDYLNDLDDNIGYEVEEGIEEAVGIAEAPSYRLVPPSYEPYKATTDSLYFTTEAPYPHTGYQTDAGYNEFVDGLILNMVDDIVKRKMDPIFFRMRNRTHITNDRKIQKKDTSSTKGSDVSPSSTSMETNPTAAPVKSTAVGAADPTAATTKEKKQEAKMKSLERNSLGGGFVTGLREIARVGDASVRGQSVKQIQSNLTIGPVMLELNVRRTRASIRRQKAKGRQVRHTRQIRVTSGVLNGNVITELNGEQTKLIHFSVLPPDPEKTQVTTKRNKSVNNRLDKIGKDIVKAVLHEGSFIMKRIRRAAERAAKKQTVEL